MHYTKVKLRAFSNHSVMEVAHSVYKSYVFMWIVRARAECIIKSSQKFKDAWLGIWGSFSVDLCNLILLFFLLFFGLWRAENLQDRTENFSFFEGKLPVDSISSRFLPFKNVAWYCLNSSYTCLGAEQWWVAWLGARAQSEIVTIVSAQVILCNRVPTTHAHKTPMKTKCSGRRILPCGSSSCFLIAFLDHSVMQSDF